MLSFQSPLWFPYSQNTDNPIYKVSQFIFPWGLGESIQGDLREVGAVLLTPGWIFFFGRRSDGDPVRRVGCGAAVPGAGHGASGAPAAALSHAGQHAAGAGGGQLHAQVVGVQGKNSVRAGRLLLTHQNGDHESPS